MARAERAHAILSAAKDVDAKRMSPPDATLALRTGRVSLVVVPTADGYAYRYDPTRPESRLARAVTDDLLQRGEGRSDEFRPQTRAVTEPGSRYIDFLVPGLIGFGLMSTGFWGIGFSLAEMRTKKLLERLMATPMRRTEFSTCTSVGRSSRSWRSRRSEASPWPPRSAVPVRAPFRAGYLVDSRGVVCTANTATTSFSHGLAVAADRFRGEKVAAHIVLTRGERSELAEVAANLL